MNELNDKLESLPYSNNNFWRNEHYAISKRVDERMIADYHNCTEVTFSIFLGHHLPISTFTARYIDGEIDGMHLTVLKPLTPEEITLKIMMI